MKNPPKHEPDINGIPAAKIRKFKDKFPERSWYEVMVPFHALTVVFYRDKERKIPATSTSRDVLYHGCLFFLTDWEFTLHNNSTPSAIACILVGDQVFWMRARMDSLFRERNIWPAESSEDLIWNDDNRPEP